MLEQLKYCYQIGREVEAYKAENIKVIEKRLDEWEKKNND